MFAMVGVSGGNGITVDVVDSAAPVVVSGTLVPSSSQPAGRNSDTLIVQFSEATIIPDNTTKPDNETLISTVVVITPCR